MRSQWIGWVGVLSVCLAVGCSNGHPDVARATGVVTLDGKPIEGATVMFHPVGGGARSSFGATKSDGTFSMSTFGMNDGALLGKHKVTIAKAERPPEANFDTNQLRQQGYGGAQGYADMMGPAAGQKLEVEYIIPEKYSKQDTSGIEVEVSEGGKNEFTFNMESE